MPYQQWFLSSSVPVVFKNIQHPLRWRREEWLVLHALNSWARAPLPRRGVAQVILCNKNSSHFDQLKYVPWFCLPEMILIFFLSLFDLMTLYSAVRADCCLFIKILLIIWNIVWIFGDCIELRLNCHLQPSILPQHVLIMSWEKCIQFLGKWIEGGVGLFVSTTEDWKHPAHLTRTHQYSNEIANEQMKRWIMKAQINDF